MPLAKSTKKDGARVVLLAEEDVIVRLAIAEYLRRCDFGVIEAASAEEARSILVAGPKINVFFADAQLAGPESGFALAQWVRRHRPGVDVILTATIEGKVLAVGALCSHADTGSLGDDIKIMLAERARRLRKPSATSPLVPPKRRALKKRLGS